MMVMAHLEPKLAELVVKMLGGYDPVAAIVENETARGFKVIRPGDAPWFRATDWRAASIASLDGKRARLVLIHSFESNQGAMTRTIAAIQDARLNPAIVDPTPELATTLTRRGWRSRDMGSSFDDRETIWFPRRAR